MAIRSLDEIWVDANFKETQLRDLRIGQPVDLDVDMYGGRQVFKGRICRLHHGDRIDAGAAAGAERDRQLRQGGAAAAGRIELEDYDPDKNPLFIGTSVVPVCRHQRAADRARCREVSASRCPSPAIPVRRERAGRREMTDAVLAPSRSARRGGEPLGGGRDRRGADLHGGARHHDRASSRCAISPAACRRRSTTANGSSPATLPPTPSSCRSPAGCRAHLGRRNYFLLSIAVFTLASALCGMATSLGQLILFRVMQGLAGGGLQPSSQGVLLDAFPRGKARHGDDAVRPGRPARAGRRPDARRLDHRRVFVALGVLSSTCRSGSWRLLAVMSCCVIRTISSRQRAELRKRPFQFRLDRPVAAGHRRWSAGK